MENKNTVLANAYTAFDDMVKNFWGNDRFVNYDTNMIWEYAVVLFGFETMYKVSKNEDIKKFFEGQFNYVCSYMDDEKITETGDCPNPAMDDAAWTAMVMLATYNMTGNKHALALCRKMINKAYAYWKDGSLSNGIWYRYLDKGNPNGDCLHCKSLYSVGLMLSALKYHELTKGSELEDMSLVEQTMELYDWVERSLLRDAPKTFRHNRTEIVDNLYYCDFGHNEEDGEYGPRCSSTPRELGVVAMFGNMGMACIHAALYRLSGDEKYKERALTTAKAIVFDYYDDGGVLKNDRDAYTNCTFIGYFISEVCTLDPALADRFAEIMENTSYAIMELCRTPEGKYSADWNGKYRWDGKGVLGSPEKIMTCANAVHALYAAALVQNVKNKA